MDQPATPDQHPTPAAAQPVSVVADQDWFLKATLEVLVSRGVEFKATLTVGGAIVSGTVISGATYFEELGNLLAAASAADGDMASLLGSQWKQYAAIYRKPDDAPDDWKSPPLGYIHLRKAHYFAPGQPSIPAGGMLWRGKLSSIDGFSIGGFSADGR